MLYGERAGQTYRDDSGRLVHEVDETSAYRTDKRGRGLWRVDYGPTTPGGFRERQIEGDAQFHAKSPADFRKRLGALTAPA